MSFLVRVVIIQDPNVTQVKDMQTNLSLKWKGYQVHFENELSTEINNFIEALDGDISMIDKAQYRLNFNRMLEIEKQSWRVNDLRKPEKIMGDLYKLRNDLNS